ncbi:MAG: phage terminase large subunit family protein [Firmicutes bacterium]|nr:phage terminase large subunit family protein [Bacillota bacterium]
MLKDQNKKVKSILEIKKAIDEIERQKIKTADFIQYSRQNFILDNKQAYDPIERPFMEEIVSIYNSHPHITIEKGAQTGFSTLAIAHVLYMVDVLKRNVIYYLPTDRMAERFGKTRFDPYINRSQYLKGRLNGTDQPGLKEIDSYFLYILGLVSKTGAISIPADEIVFDEVALINQENMDLAQDRISAPGSLGWQKYFSVALYEEDGIDDLFQLSDMRKWLIKCSGCGHYSTVEDEFPECFVKKGGEVSLVCIKCGKKLDVTAGKWVPEHPDRSKDRLGYRVPQLIVPGANLQLIWNRWGRVQDKPSKRAQFRRSVLALPDSGNMQPVSSEVLKRVEAASDYFFTDYSARQTGVGIDMGDNAHVAVAEPYEDGIRLLHFWEIDVEDLGSLVEQIEKKFNVGCLIIDAMPYKTESKKVVRSLRKATGYIQYFSGSEMKEGTEGKDEKEVRKITVDRDESLDETTDLFACTPPLALLPKPRNTDEEKIISTVKSHLKKLVKEEIGEGESKIIRYKRNVPNHFGMAINSARMAVEFVTKGVGKGVIFDEWQLKVIRSMKVYQ